MPLQERISSADLLRSWTDRIPFEYEYTAGVAGEKFLRGLQLGKVLASRCGNCGKMYLPPKMYCVDCFLEIRNYRDVGSRASVGAIAKSHVDFEGKRLERPRTFAFIVFEGVTGGLVHYAVGDEKITIGAKVKPKFKPPGQRKGTMLDLVGFVPV